MARAVFEAPTPGSEGQDKDRSPVVARRQPLIKGGAASDKYILAAAQGGVDRTYQEISPDQIQDSLIKDRIDISEDLTSLIESIKEKGQHIPIHVRIIQGDLPYEIVVGRRRLAAIRALGKGTIKAFVSKMSDSEAFIAQGIENSARLETSFIERSRAASQASDVGRTQEDISSFLNIGQPLISTMVKIYKSIGEDVVVKVGPARGVGRRRWEGLAALLTSRDVSISDAAAMVDTTIESSVERFEALIKRLETGRLVTPKVKKPKIDDRKVFLGGGLSTVRKPQLLVIKTSKELPPHILDEIQSKVEDVVKSHMKDEKEKD